MSKLTTIAYGHMVFTCLFELSLVLAADWKNAIDGGMRSVNLETSDAVHLANARHQWLFLVPVKGGR